jgi:hypothetical protein
MAERGQILSESQQKNYSTAVADALAGHRPDVEPEDEPRTCDPPSSNPSNTAVPTVG